MKKLIEVGMFAEVVDTRLFEHDIKKGDIIYVAGDTVVSVDEKDPYALRKIFIAAYVENGHILVHKKPFLVDAKRLAPVSKAKQEKFEAIKLADFDGEKSNEQAKEEEKGNAGK